MGEAVSTTRENQKGRVERKFRGGECNLHLYALVIGLVAGHKSEPFVALIYCRTWKVGSLVDFGILYFGVFGDLGDLGVSVGHP